MKKKCVMNARKNASRKDARYRMKNRWFSLFFAIALMVTSFVGDMDTAYAHYTGDIEMTVNHAKDCPCGFPETDLNYFIPGSTHKFELATEQLSNSPKLDEILGLTYEWKSSENSILTKEEGMTAWYRLEGLSNDPEWDYFTIGANFSYTGYVSDGVTVTQSESGIASKLYYLFEEFWLISPSCNPKITIERETSQALKLYAKHCTTSFPYGKAADITSWVDWSKAGSSGCGVKVRPDGVLEAFSKNGTGWGDFAVSIFQAIRQSPTLPKGAIWNTFGTIYCITGTVVKNQSQQPASNKFTASNGNTYQVTGSASQKAVAFCGNKKKASSLTIPDTITNNGTKYKVTAIAAKAMKASSSLKSVSIGKNVTSIGKEAFSACSALTTVKGCQNIKSIAAQAFQGCKKLTAVNGCTKTSSIGSKAFYNCPKLKTIGKPSGTITLPAVKEIGSSAFSACKSIRKVNLTSAALVKINSGAFSNCPALTSFAARSAKLKTIGKAAFGNDKNLKSITLKTTRLTKATIGANAFKNINKTCTFKVPAPKVSAYKSLFRSKGAGSKIKVKK